MVGLTLRLYCLQPALGLINIAVSTQLPHSHVAVHAFIAFCDFFSSSIFSPSPPPPPPPLTPPPPSLPSSSERGGDKGPRMSSRLTGSPTILGVKEGQSTHQKKNQNCLHCHFCLYLWVMLSSNLWPHLSLMVLVQYLHFVLIVFFLFISSSLSLASSVFWLLSTAFLQVCSTTAFQAGCANFFPLNPVKPRVTASCGSGPTRCIWGCYFAGQSVLHSHQKHSPQHWPDVYFIFLLCWGLNTGPCVCEAGVVPLG